MTAENCQPGGGLIQSVDPEEHRRTPASVRENQIAATVAGYRAQARADGIPFRSEACPHGMTTFQNHVISITETGIRPLCFRPGKDG
jgi:hypothetical protein